MDEEDEVPLGLGLGIGDYTTNGKPQSTKKRVFLVDLSFPLHESNSDGTTSAEDSSPKHDCKSSGFFRGISAYKEEIHGGGGGGNSSHSKDFGRKKLRLTRDQTTLLEDSFRHQTTLNMAEKQALAEKLKLKPRQVEVWFQNRRARTKLKQTEVDCEFLKKNCKRLLEENRLLKEELSKLGKSLPEFLRNPSVPEKMGKYQHRGGGEIQAVVPGNQP